jgi:hypothetical protein
MAGILLLVVSPVVVYTIFQSSSGSKAEQWPSTEGKIIRSNVKTVRTGETNAFKADIEYRFMLDGKIYASTRLSYAESAESSESAARALTEKYPLNSTQKIFYSPRDPTQSLLDPGSGRHEYWLYLIPLATFGAGFYLLRLSRQQPWIG